MSGLPFKPGDWVQDGCDRVARVRGVHQDRFGVFFDLVMFHHSGEQIGRISPALGGPRTYEPCCSIEGWRRVKRPDFPLTVQWVPDGKGRKQARLWAGDTLPPADWTPRQRRSRAGSIHDTTFRRALEQIAKGHNDARQLATDTLNGKRTT